MSQTRASRAISERCSAPRLRDSPVTTKKSGSSRLPAPSIALKTSASAEPSLPGIARPARNPPKTACSPSQAVPQAMPVASTTAIGSWYDSMAFGRSTHRRSAGRTTSSMTATSPVTSRAVTNSGRFGAVGEPAIAAARTSQAATSIAPATAVATTPGVLPARPRSRTIAASTGSAAASAQRLEVDLISHDEHEDHDRHLGEHRQEGQGLARKQMVRQVAGDPAENRRPEQYAGQDLANHGRLTEAAGRRPEHRGHQQDQGHIADDVGRHGINAHRQPPGQRIGIKSASRSEAAESVDSQ